MRLFKPTGLIVIVAALYNNKDLMQWNKKIQKLLSNILKCSIELVKKEIKKIIL